MPIRMLSAVTPKSEGVNMVLGMRVVTGQSSRHGTIHLMSVSEGREHRLPCFDRPQEIPRFDDDLILITRSVPLPLAERLVIGMRRTGQDFHKPSRRLRTLHTEAAKPLLTHHHTENDAPWTP